MELPDRPQLEAAFVRKLSRLNSKHRRELRGLMGIPADVRNVPSDFWLRVENEMREEEAAALFLLFMASANFHATGEIGGRGLDISTRSQLNFQAEAFSQRRATDSARDYVSVARLRTQDLGEMIRQATQADELLTRQRVEDELTKIFGPERAEKFGVTDMTAAQSAGGDAGIEATVGKTMQDLWITEDDDRVCPTCRPLHRTRREDWERLFPQGPPAHPMCRCIVEYVNKEVARSAA